MIRTSGLAGSEALMTRPGVHQEDDQTRTLFACPCGVWKVSCGAGREVKNLCLHVFGIGFRTC
jgi:hypothetical protein